ncbi:reverse transcriptase domain-containing protein [Tanacetum coccineum]
MVLVKRYPFDYRVTLGFGSIAGGLDPVSPVIRVPIEHGINSGTRIGTMAGVDINTLTMEQYLALSQENQVPGVVKLEIRGNVNFEIKRTAKRWVDRFTPRAVNTWDLLKKAFIQRFFPTSMTAKRLEDIHNFKQEIDESLYQAWERFNDLLTSPRQRMSFQRDPPGYYTPADNQTSSGEKRPNMIETIIKYMEEAAKRQAEQDEWLKTFYQNTKNYLIDHDKII